MPKLVAAVLLSALTVGLVVACGSENATVEDGTGDGGADPNGPGLGGDGGPAVRADGSAGDGAAFVCLAPAAKCCADADCCSGACVDGACAAPNNDAGKAVCGAPGVDCNAHEDCCGGRCEPVTGQTGVKKCLDACRGDGVACTRAQDCCSLGCFGGVCAAQLCKLQSEACTADADCCSGICDPGTKTCKIDTANSTCRPTGEVCGSGPQSGCCLRTKDDDLCKKDPFGESRCALPATTCKGITAACATDAECCGGRCDPGTKKCAAACLPDGAACTACAGNGCVTRCGDCCSGGCVNGVCGAPPATAPGTPSGPGAQPLGTPCTDALQCSSGFCLGGFCDSPIR